MSEEGFTVLAKEIAVLVNSGETEKARCKLARLAAQEYGRGADEKVKAVEGPFLSLLAGAVVCNDARDFILGMIDTAHSAGLTEDGRTLTIQGKAALDRGSGP